MNGMTTSAHTFAGMTTPTHALDGAPRARRARFSPSRGCRPITANATAIFASAQVNFVVNSLCTWRDRRHPGSWRRRWGLFHVSIAGTVALNMLAVTLVRAALLTLAASGIGAGAIANVLLGGRLFFSQGGDRPGYPLRRRGEMAA